MQCASRDDWRCARSMHEFSAKDIDGHMVNLDKYRWALACGGAHGRGLGGGSALLRLTPADSCRGFVCIVTNVASQ